MKRKPDYIVERAIHGDKFKDQVIELITGQYNISKDEAKVAFENCMSCDYAVIKPVSKEYPNGIMIATDLHRQKVAIG
jgi:hypothetical protein